MTETTKTLVATGGSSGLGFEAIRQLLQEASQDTQYKIILGCRDIEATKQAYEHANVPDRHQLVYLPLQLSDLAKTNIFAEKVKEELGDQPLNTLLLCAGISKAPSGKDIEKGKWSETYIVNYAAQQYLLLLLEEKITQSHARVVIVTSMLYKKIEDPAQLESIVSSSSKARSIEVYRATKFIQLASVAKWADRFAGKAEIVAVSPGFVPETNLSREIGWIGRLFMYYIMSWAPFATSLHDGGQAILWAIQLPKLPEDGSRKVLSKSGEWEEMNDRVLDPAVGERWWLSLEDVQDLARA